MVRRAASSFSRSRALGPFLEAKTVECRMLHEAGDLHGAAGVWTTTWRAAQARGDAELAGHVSANLGVLALHGGDPHEAARLLRHGVDLLEQEEANTLPFRRRLADAEAARGKPYAAISELHHVQAGLLARGSFVEAAVAAADLLDLYLQVRPDQAAQIASGAVEAFERAGAATNVVEALAWLQARAEREELDRDDVAFVREYCDELHRKPKMRFRAP